MTKQKRFEGNSVGEAQALQKELSALGVRAMRFEETAARLTESGLWLSGFRVRFPTAVGGEYLQVWSAETEQGYVVAFNSGYSLKDVLLSGFGRLEAGGVTWKADEYKK